jgi:hypothetical protein
MDPEILVGAFNAHETPAAFTTPDQATAAVENGDAITAIVVPGDDGNGASAHGGLVGLRASARRELRDRWLPVLLRLPDTAL